MHPPALAVTRQTVQSDRVTDSPVDAVCERVVAGILRDGEKVLLCHRHPDRQWYPNVWDLPGGHVEPGEQPQIALVRELFEELAVLVSCPEGAPFRDVSDRGVQMTVWLIDYDGPLVNAASDEHDELRWFTRDAIAAVELAHPDYGEMLRSALEDG
jgi:8-oxo-dGTP pyrophosphatase MutT (NUDIX family)